MIVAFCSPVYDCSIRCRSNLVIYHFISHVYGICLCCVYHHHVYCTQ